MKRLLIFLLLFITIIITPSTAFAQGMMGSTSSPQVGAQPDIVSDDHTAREEAEGKEIWDKLQSNQLTCKDLTDENFQALGEYFMGQSIGNTERHTAMNQMMTNMMGEEGEKQMHITLGKRSSGCNSNAPLPTGYNFMPMMWMMGSAFSRPSSGFGGTKGGGNSMMGYGGWNNMMGGWNGFGILGWLPMLLFWILLILGVVALLRYLGKSGQQQKHRTPLDILKERYAKGEIDKKEFELMKKDLA